MSSCIYCGKSGRKPNEETSKKTHSETAIGASIGGEMGKIVV